MPDFAAPTMRKVGSLGAWRPLEHLLVDLRDDDRWTAPRRTWPRRIPGPRRPSPASGRPSSSHRRPLGQTVLPRHGPEAAGEAIGVEADSIGAAVGRGFEERVGQPLAYGGVHEDPGRLVAGRELRRRRRGTRNPGASRFGIAARLLPQPAVVGRIVAAAHGHEAHAGKPSGEVEEPFDALAPVAAPHEERERRRRLSRRSQRARGPGSEGTRTPRRRARARAARRKGAEQNTRCALPHRRLHRRGSPRRATSPEPEGGDRVPSSATPRGARRAPADPCRSRGEERRASPAERATWRGWAPGSGRGRRRSRGTRRPT